MDRSQRSTTVIIICFVLSALAPTVRVGSWMGGPMGIAPPLNVFTPAIYGGPLLGGIGNSSGYSFESYSGPGYSYHYERIF